MPEKHEKEVDLTAMRPIAPMQDTRSDDPPGTSIIKFPKMGTYPKATIKDGASQIEVLDALLDMKESFIPWEDLTLPSRGFFYDGKIPGGLIKIKGMDLGLEKILTTQRLLQNNQALDYIFKHHVKFPNEFNPLDLLNGDRVFLLFVLRGITYGNQYEFSLTCGECKQKTIHTYDLNELGNTIRFPVHTKEPIEVELPYSTQVAGRRVYAAIRYLRQRDTQAIAQRQKTIGKALRGGSEIILNQEIEEQLNHAIVSINGQTDRHKIDRWISKPPHMLDVTAIKQFLEETAPGIDTEIEIECQCGVKTKVDLPVVDQFFRPTHTQGA